MELTFHSCPGADSFLNASPDHTVDEVAPPDHMGIRAAIFWLVVGSAMVGTAIVAFGWKRTLEVWAISGVVLAIFFLAARLCYIYVLKT
jgi:hypothetical protein